MDDLLACSTVTPFFLRISAYRSANFAQVAGARVEHGRGGEVDAEFGCAGTHLALVAENGQLGDAAAQQPAGGLQDTVVVPFGRTMRLRSDRARP